MAFYSIDTWGNEIENFRMGQVCATVANVFGGKKDSKKPFVPVDFYPQSGKPNRKRQAAQQMKDILVAALGLGPKSKKKERKKEKKKAKKKRKKKHGR